MGSWLWESRFEKFKAKVKIIHYILFIKVVNEQIFTREIQTGEKQL